MTKLTNKSLDHWNVKRNISYMYGIYVERPPTSIGSSFMICFTGLIIETKLSRSICKILISTCFFEIILKCAVERYPALNWVTWLLRQLKMNNIFVIPEAIVDCWWDYANVHFYDRLQFVSWAAILRTNTAKRTTSGPWAGLLHEKASTSSTIEGFCLDPFLINKAIFRMKRKLCIQDNQNFNSIAL